MESTIQQKIYGTEDVYRAVWADRDHLLPQILEFYGYMPEIWDLLSILSYNTRLSLKGHDIRTLGSFKRAEMKISSFIDVSKALRNNQRWRQFNLSLELKDQEDIRSFLEFLRDYAECSFELIKLSDNVGPPRSFMTEMVKYQQRNGVDHFSCLSKIDLKEVNKVYRRESLFGERKFAGFNASYINGFKTIKKLTVDYDHQITVLEDITSKVQGISFTWCRLISIDFSLDIQLNPSFSESVKIFEIKDIILTDNKKIAIVQAYAKDLKRLFPNMDTIRLKGNEFLSYENLKRIREKLGLTFRIKFKIGMKSFSREQSLTYLSSRNTRSHPFPKMILDSTKTVGNNTIYHIPAIDIQFVGRKSSIVLRTAYVSIEAVQVKLDGRNIVLGNDSYYRFEGEIIKEIKHSSTLFEGSVLIPKSQIHHAFYETGSFKGLRDPSGMFIPSHSEFIINNQADIKSMVKLIEHNLETIESVSIDVHTDEISHLFPIIFKVPKILYILNIEDEEEFQFEEVIENLNHCEGKAILKVKGDASIIGEVLSSLKYHDVKYKVVFDMQYRSLHLIDLEGEAEGNSEIEEELLVDADYSQTDHIPTSEVESSLRPLIAKLISGQIRFLKPWGPYKRAIRRVCQG